MTEHHPLGGVEVGRTDIQAFAGLKFMLPKRVGKAVTLQVTADVLLEPIVIEQARWKVSAPVAKTPAEELAQERFDDLLGVV